MNFIERTVVAVYARLTMLYPYSFRHQFTEEMICVFQDVVSDASRHGKWGLLQVSFREFYSMPCSLLMEYVHNIRKFFSGLIMLATGRNITGDNEMVQMIMKGNKDFETQREKWLAAVPPLLFAAGIALMWLVVGRVNFSEMPRWRLYLSVALGMLPNGLILLGAVVAIYKNLPAWGYTWVGALTLGLFLLLKATAEELLEAGMAPLSGVGETLVSILLLLVFVFVLGIIALRGWWQVGLVSIGMASVFGLAICHSVAIPPINYRGLAFISIPVALLTSGMIYVYIQGKTWHKVLAFVIVEAFNVGLAVMAGQAAQLSQATQTRGAYPVTPLINLMTVILLCGPVLGLLIAPLRRTLKAV